MHKRALLVAFLAVAGSRLASDGFFRDSIADFIFLVLLPAAFIALSRSKLSEFGFSPGDIRTGLKYAAFFYTAAIPFMVIGSRISSFAEYYPLWKPAYESTGNLLSYELAVGLMLFSTEFFYRGFLLFTLKGQTKHAVLIQALLYALMHVGKPSLEVPYSLLAGLVFGMVAMRCKSILPSFLMHYVGNITFDLLLITHSLQ
jgi:membrane protease YdiL (CAAX protease family)